MFGVKAALARADNTIDILCRKCNTKPETLGRVLGECFSHKDHRFHCHNEIVELEIKHCLDKGCQAAKEPSLRVSGERLKPDIIVNTTPSRFVVDVSVRFEDYDSLERAARKKSR